ncbi:MAG: PEGA domain-containing protein [Myxococcota bacterium]|nr:PEGA domain-containing protein [Myxococcota bacterium]
MVADSSRSWRRDLQNVALQNVGLLSAASSIALALAIAIVLPAAAARAQVDEDEGGAGPQRIAAPAEAGASADGVEQQRVYVISVPMSEGLDAVAQRAGAAARASLRRVEGVEWRHADQLFLGYDESALEVLGRARERLDAGRQAYLNLDLPAAIEQLTGAVADFDAAAAALEDPEDLGQALLFLGASLAFEGRARDAQRVFARLHVQMPQVQPDPNTFNPDIMARFEAARPRDAQRPEATIRIESDPPGAIAYVDFLARGVTPIDVGGLHGGEHVVRVTRAGATPFVQTITVRARGTESTSAYLVDSDRTGGLADTLAQVPEADPSTLTATSPIRQIAEVLELDRIGVIRVAPGSSDEQVALELLVFDVASGRRLVRGAGTAPTGVGELERGVDQLVSGALEAALTQRQLGDAERIPAARSEGPAPVTPPSEPSIAEQWWLWAIVGGVVVAVAVGVGVGVAVSEQGPGVGNDPQGYVVLEF